MALISKVLEMLACIAVIVYMPLDHARREANTGYRLIECSGVSKCEDLGIFRTQDVCYSMRDKLNDDRVIFLYECEETK